MEAQKQLDTAYNLLSNIYVRGNDVELMAAAKQAIKKAYNLLNNKEEKDG